MDNLVSFHLKNLQKNITKFMYVPKKFIVSNIAHLESISLKLFVVEVAAFSVVVFGTMEVAFGMTAFEWLAEHTLDCGFQGSTALLLLTGDI